MPLSNGSSNPRELAEFEWLTPSRTVDAKAGGVGYRFKMKARSFNLEGPT
jgi:hypothetical protein